MNYKWKAMITVAMGTMMGTMDVSITTIAFPELTLVFNSTLPTVMWVAVAYILVSSSLMLVMGKISDLTGRKRVYAGGMAIFTLGMGACAFTQTIDQLIIRYLLQQI
jgi:MFS family permease